MKSKFGSDPALPHQMAPKENLGNSLPPEVCVQIFSHYVKSEGVSNLISNICPVSPIWEGAAKNFTLWNVVDDYMTKEDFLILCQEGQLSRTKVLKISRFGPCLDSQELRSIAKNCPMLREFDCSFCENADFVFFDLLTKHCTNIVSVNFSKINNSVAVPSIMHFLRERGNCLTQLNLSDCSHNVINLDAIADCCPHLRKLCVTNITGTVCTKMEKLQICCPLLTELRLSPVTRESSIWISEEVRENSPGFPELEILAIGFDFRSRLFPNYISFLLKTSKKLKSLELNGCQYIYIGDIISIPSKVLEYLHLASFSMYSGGLVYLILLEFKDSLKCVDFGNSRTIRFINRDLFLFFENIPSSSIEKLNLANSSVDINTVSSILKSCVKLLTLDLRSCIFLPESTRKIHKGQQKLKRLFSKFKKL